MFKHKIISVILVAVLVIPWLTACSDPNKPVDVRITLSEFKIVSSRTSFEVGVPYHFIVTNKGDIAHEIMLMKPMMTPAGMDMEEMDKMALANIETDDLPVGGKASFDFTFVEPATSSELEFACHIAGHYEAGMNLPITVTK